MPIDINDIPQSSVADRYKTQYDTQFETLPQMSLSVPRSKYDEGYIYNQLDPYGSLNEQRAQSQPWTAKLGLGIGKALVLTGTTAVDGIIGTAVGLGNMALEGKGSAFWNNPVSSELNDINNKLDEWMPIYQTKASKNASFVGQMGYADFWGDKFLKNLGFTAGMILDGIITGGASMEITGARALAAKLPKAIANAAIKGDRALGMAIQSEDMINIAPEIIKNAKQLSKISNRSQAVSSLLAAQGEARFEAINNSTRFYDDNKNKLDNQLATGLIDADTYNKQLDKLKVAQEGYGNADFLANVVILGISNGIQFKNLFTKGFNPTKSIAEGITGSISEGYKYTKPLASQTAKILKNVLAEGVFEEQGQYAAQKASEDFYQKKYNGLKQDKLDDIFHSVYTGINQAYGTREGWDQGLIGSLTGAIGLPTISRNQKTGKYGVDWASGIIPEIREVKEENEYNQNAVNHLNQTLQSDDFKNNYQSLIRNLALEDEKTAFALAGNKNEVLNKQHEQFINDALQFIKAGKYEDFIDNIKDIKGSNAEEVRQLFQTHPTTVEDQIREFYGLKREETEGQKKAKDIFGNYTSDEIVEKLNKNADTMLFNAKTIHNLYNAFTTQYPTLSEDAKEKLIFTASKLENINQRINEINKESMSKFGIDINNHVKIKEDKSTISVDLSDYNKEYKRVADDQKLTGRFNADDDIVFRAKVKDLPKLIADKIDYTNTYKSYTTDKGIIELENQVNKEKETIENLKKETGTYNPTIDDNVIYEGITYTIQSINEDGTYNLVDKDGVIRENINKDSTIYQPKKGDLEPQDSIESLNDSDIPEKERSFNLKRERGLKEVASSLSVAHWDEDKGETIIRDKEYNKYVSSSSNKLVGDRVTFTIDTDNLDKYKQVFWDLNKDLHSKIISGTPLTDKEAIDILNNIRKVRGEDVYESTVDLIPLSATYTTSDGTIYNKELYYHESRYDNIHVPARIRKEGDKAVKDYIKAQMDLTRQNRKSILFALLTGKEVQIGIKGKSKGIPNNTGVNKRIDEVLKTSHNRIKLGVALGSGLVWTGHKSSPIEGYGSPGNIFFETDKTCNGEKALIKANVSKISREHAEILWNSILTMYYYRNGYNTEYNGPEVENLTVGEVINLLTYMGSRTDLSNPSNEGKLGEHLRNKQLYVDGNLVLHYGENTIPLKGGIYSTKSGIDQEVEKQKFIEWAINNKNYAINKELPKMGIELNKQMKSQFKLGSWKSDGKDTYAGFLIKNGVVQTDLDEFEDTGSLFFGSIAYLDITNSGLKVVETPKVVKESKKTKEGIAKDTSKKTNNPINTGTKKVVVGEQIEGNKLVNEELRSLPIGTVINYPNTSTDSADVETTVFKKLVEVVNKNGKKQFKVYPKAHKYFFTDEQATTFFQKGNIAPTIDVNDDSVIALEKAIKGMKAIVNTIDTPEGVKQSVVKPKEKITKVEESIDLGTPIEALQEEESPFKEDSEIDKTISKSVDLTNWIDGSEVEWGDETPTKLAYVPTTSYKVFDLNKELSWLNNKLGDIPVEVKDGLIDLARTSKKAFGLLKNNVIILSNIAEEGTTYHEAFHKVSLLYLDNETREKIYNEARSRYANDLNKLPNGKLENVFKYEDEYQTEDLSLKTLDNKAYYSPDTKNFIDASNINSYLKNKFDEYERMTAGGTHAYFEWLDNFLRTTKRPYNQGIKFTLEDNVVKVEYDVDDFLKHNPKYRLDREQIFSNIFDSLEILYNKIGDVQVNIPELKLNDKLSSILGKGQDVVSNYQVEEYLAERFREYVISRESTSPKELTIFGKIGKWFSDLYQMVKNIFTGSNKLTNLDIDKLFSSIQEGKFRTYNPLEENLNKLKGKEQPLELQGQKLEAISTGKQLKSIVRGLASIATKRISEQIFNPKKTKYGNINISDALKELDFDKIKDTIEKNLEVYRQGVINTGQVVELIQKGTLGEDQFKFLSEKYNVKSKSELSNLMHNIYQDNTQKVELWSEVLKHYDDIFKDRVRDYISNELGIRRNVDDSDNLASKELTKFDKASYEYSLKENVMNSVKFALSNLHTSKEKNPYTGLYEFVTMDEIWSRLMADLHHLDTIEEMLEVLESKSSYYPYEELTKKLKEKGSELLLTQFEVSFRKHRHAFLNAMFNKVVNNDRTDYQFYFTDADIHKASSQTIRTWGEMFAMSSLVEDGKINTKTLNSIFKEYEDLKETYKQDMVSKLLVDSESMKPYKNRLVNILNKLHIEVDDKTIDRLIENIKKSNHIGTDQLAFNAILLDTTEHLFSKHSTLYRYANAKETGSKLTLELKNLFQNESAVKELATAFVEVNPQDTSDMVPGAEGSPHYVYSDHTYITDVIKELTKDDTEYLDNLLKSPFEKGSYILNLLQDKDVRSEFAVKTFNAFLREKGDEGRGYLDISPIEDFLFKLYAFDKGYIPMPTLADRKTYPLLSGIKLPNFRYIVAVNEEPIITKEIVDIFYEYALAEKNRIDQAWETLRKYSEVDTTGKLDKDGGPAIVKVLDWSKLVENYHYITDNKTKNKDKGLAYKYQIFTSFNKEGFNFDRDARKEIESILSSHIDRTVKWADRLGITDNGMNQLIDSSIVERIAKEYGGDTRLAIKHILADYTTKTMISSMESMMLFTGDLAFYKDAEDYVKRLSVLTSSGTLLRLNIPGEFTNDNYTTTTLTRSRFDSTYYDTLYNKQKELLQEKYSDKDKKFIEDLLEERLKNYTDRKLDPTDAQVYLSPEMFREISIRRGQWGDEEEEAFNLLNSTEEISSDIEQKLLNVVLNPLKYVYFDKLALDTNEDERINIPTYDKMSMATLFRRYVSGTYMEDILDRMEGVGKYEGLPKIHMVKYDTAVKVGNRLRTEQFKNVNTDKQEENDLSNIALYEQNFRFLRHQVVTDPHDEQHSLFGTQAKKVGMANIINDADYTINGETIKGEEVKRNINKALSSLSNKGVQRILSKLGVDANDNIDDEKFRELLLKEGKSAGLSENILEGIRIGLSMDSMPERKWVYSRLISMVNKETIDTYLPGNQMVQMSGYGLGFKDSKTKFDKTNNLKFIFDDEGKVTGLECKVSISVFNNILPIELDTYEKKIEWLKSHKDLLKGLGYRIPTQGQNSMVPLNIVEFLPEQMGDVIILPNEFTALTGSDFDIDKLFFMRYNYKVNKDNEVVKVNSDLNGSKEEIENYLLDLYRGVLLSDHHFLSTSSPLGGITDRLKKLAGTLTKSTEEKIPLSFTSPVYQAEVKYKYSGGKFGIGPFALNNVHHIMCQVADISFKEDIGLGIIDPKTNGTSLHELYGLPESNGEEVLISDWLSALIDSHVDIAKDPYIINLNVVKRTYNVVNLLVRIGMGMKSFEFISQPILKSLVHETINGEGDVVNDPYDNAKKINSRVVNEYKLHLGNRVTEVLDQLELYKPFEDDLLKLALVEPKDRDELWYGKQLKIFDEFLRLDDKSGKDLNALVMASRVDTKKYGNNLTAIKIYSDGLKKVIEDNKFNNLEKLVTLNEDELDNSSYISTYYANSVDLIQRLFSNKTITGTKKFNDIIDNILLSIGEAGTRNEGLVNKIADSLYSAFASRFFSGDPYMLNLNSNQVKTIINNVNNFVLNAVDNHLELKENVLIQSLTKGRTTTSNDQVFVGIPGIKADDNFIREDLMFAWQELLQSDNPEIKRFGKELFIYSFYTSGFNKGPYTLHHYIPAKLLKEFETKDDVISFDEHMTGLVPEMINNGASYVDELSSKVIEEFFKNNWYNPKFVPVVEGIQNTLNNKAKEPAIVKLTDSQFTLLGKNNKEQLIFQPYILINVNDKSYLMEYIGYVPNNKNRPVYRLTNKMGMSEKGRRLVEYGLDKSILDSNKITEITDEQALIAIEKTPSYESFQYVEPNDRVVNSSKYQASSNMLIFNRKTYFGLLNNDTLPENGIFVFGSNPVGINGNPSKGTGGAALVATQNNWVRQDEKMDNRLSDSGKSWGLTTVSYPGKKLSKSTNEIKEGIQKLYNYALENSDKLFYIAYNGENPNKVSLNGYSSLDMAKMFGSFKVPSNIIFEDSFNKLVFTDSPLNDNTASDTSIPIEDRSLNVEAENSLKSSLTSEIESLLASTDNPEVIKLINETPVESVEDLNKLINKICSL